MTSYSCCAIPTLTQAVSHPDLVLPINVPNGRISFDRTTGRLSDGHLDIDFSDTEIWSSTEYNRSTQGIKLESCLKMKFRDSLGGSSIVPPVDIYALLGAEGCDASVLLNSTADNIAERDSIPDQTLRGFDAINDIKATVEAHCPGVVSCADIIALAARDAISVPFKKPLWEVLTGRRDGRVSKSTEALANIPAPFFDYTQLKASFAIKGLMLHELVVLSGEHTIGVANCNSFSTGLYNFTRKGDQDPSLDPTYAQFLKSKCKSLSDTTTIVAMDPNSSTSFDSHYYSSLVQNKGLFQSDAALLTDKQARETVNELLDQQDFFTEFAQAMKRLGNIEVLTGTSRESRKKCWVVNS